MSRNTLFRSNKTLASAALFFLVTVCLFILAGCQSDNAVGPKTTSDNPNSGISPDTNSQTVYSMPAPNCLHDHTADLIAGNDSRRTIYRIIIDDQFMGLLKPGATMRNVVTADVHILQFLYTTGVLAYTQTIDPFSCEEVTIRWNSEEPVSQDIGQSTEVRLK